MKKEIKRRKTFELRLTKFELLHLRDLFSVIITPELGKTLSQSLAELEDRPMVEKILWGKLSNVCQEAELPVESEAPDYVIAPTSAPGLGVFQLASEPLTEDQASDNLPFIKENSDTSDEEE